MHVHLHLTRIAKAFREFLPSTLRITHTNIQTNMHARQLEKELQFCLKTMIVTRHYVLLLGRQESHACMYACMHVALVVRLHGVAISRLPEQPPLLIYTIYI